MQNNLGHKLLRVGYLNKFLLKPRFKKSLGLQISSLVGQFKNINAFPVYSTCFNETVNNKWCLDKSVGQTENDLEPCSVKQWLNSS